MSVNVTHIDDARKAKASLQLQALILAQMNEERASYCVAGQEALREFFLMNAKLLHEVAKR
jgi:hypothetical protein